MNQFFESYEHVIFISLIAGGLVLLLAVLILSLKLKTLRKRYMKMMAGNEVSLEDVLIGLQEKMNVMEQQIANQQDQIKTMQHKMKKMKGHVAVQRYSAFDNGSDLSFSLAIVDDEMDGMVLSGIRAREHSYLYAKPVDKGNSLYSLSSEEKEVLNQALKQKD